MNPRTREGPTHKVGAIPVYATSTEFRKLLHKKDRVQTNKKFEFHKDGKNGTTYTEITAIAEVTAIVSVCFIVKYVIFAMIIPIHDDEITIKRFTI